MLHTNEIECIRSVATQDKTSLPTAINMSLCAPHPYRALLKLDQLCSSHNYMFGNYAQTILCATRGINYLNTQRGCTPVTYTPHDVSPIRKFTSRLNPAQPKLSESRERYVLFFVFYSNPRHQEFQQANGAYLRFPIALLTIYRPGGIWTWKATGYNLSKRVSLTVSILRHRSIFHLNSPLYTLRARPLYANTYHHHPQTASAATPEGGTFHRSRIFAQNK